MKVYGLDVITGSVRSRSRRPMYALVVLENNEITSEMEVSQFRLLRMLARDEPEILAVDSIQELAPDQPALCTFLQQLPPRTRLVQVTGGEKKETLGKIAARYNISVNRFDPFSEARAAARIAALDGGAEVVAFDNACDVVVSRHRSLGKGGWSQNRYVRKIHGAVLQKAREIESELRSTGLKFEKKESRAFGGASRVSFQVQASRNRIPIPAYRGADVQIRILCRRLDRIQYRPLTQRPRHLIVGIDPGTTTAYAAVDLDGNIVHIGSSRQFSMADSIEALYRIGKPLVIASDVHQMPFSVEKIRRAFQAIGFTPRVDRTVEEKQELTKGHEYANVHERDALAAALDALRHYRHRLQSVIKRVPPGYDLDEVRAGIIRGLSLEQILGTRVSPPVPLPVEPPIPPEEGKRDERVILLEGQVKRLREYVQELQTTQKAQEKEILFLQKRLRRERSAQEQKWKRDSEISRLNQLIGNLKRQIRREQQHARSLQKRLDQMRQHAALETKGNLIPLKVLPALTRDGIHTLTSALGIHSGDILYVARTDGWGRSALKELAELGVQALIVGVPVREHIDPLIETACAKFDLPLLLAPRIAAEVRGKAGTMDRIRFEEAKKEWEESQVRRERQKKTEMLESIFREYRWEREKEVHRGG